MGSARFYSFQTASLSSAASFILKLFESGGGSGGQGSSWCPGPALPGSTGCLSLSALSPHARKMIHPLPNAPPSPRRDLHLLFVLRRGHPSGPQALVAVRWSEGGRPSGTTASRVQFSAARACGRWAVPCSASEESRPHCRALPLRLGGGGHTHTPGLFPRSIFSLRSPVCFLRLFVW